MEQTDKDFIRWAINPAAGLLNACLAEGIRCYVGKADRDGFSDLFVHRDDLQKAREVHSRRWGRWGEE